MLAYANPLELPRKPGILQAMGVMSIVVAALGILTSLAFMFGILGVQTAARTWRVRTPVTAAQLAAAQAQSNRNLARANAAAASRSAAIRSLRATTQSEAFRTLSPEARAQLEQSLNDTLKRLDNLQTSVGSMPTTSTTNPAWPTAAQLNRGGPLLPPTTSSAPTASIYLPPQSTVSTSLFDWRAAGLFAVIELASISLAGYLLYCGVIVMQNSPRGYWHHINYARLKIVLVLVSIMGAVALSIFAADPQMIRGMITASVSIGWIYPIAVLVVMRRPGVIRYYRSLMGRATPG